MPSQPRTRWVLVVGLLAGVLLPGIVFVVTAVATGLSPGETVDATIAQYTTDRLNLMVTGLLALVPFAVLGIGLAVVRRFGGDSAVAPASVGGTTAILLTLLWAHASYWPSFLPHRVAPMWPHGLELVIGPLFFAPVMAVVGLLIGWLVGRSNSPSPEGSG